MKKLFFGFISMSLILSGISTATAGVKFDLNWPYQGIKIQESWVYSHVPAIYGYTRNNDQFSPGYFCDTLESQRCTDAVNVFLIDHLPPCNAAILINCISEIYAVDDAGKITQGVFQRLVPASGSHDFAASEKNNLPQGKGSGAIWKIPGVTHSGGTDEYYASTFINGWLNKDKGKKITNEKFELGQFNSTILPATEKSGAYKPFFLLDSTRPGWKVGSEGAVAGGNDSSAPDSKDCLITTEGTCVMAQEFPQGYRFGMKLILAQAQKGWFHGRMFQPEISVTGGLGSPQVIQVEALPVTVPTLVAQLPTAEIPQNLRDYLSMDVQRGVSDYALIPGNSGQEAFEAASLWLPILKDKATTSKTYWNFHTLNLGNEEDKVRSCSSSSGELAGVVNTNSLVYSAGPPAFDAATQTLDYKLLSPHYKADGEVSIGTYDLALRSDVARCIYGFNNAPIQGKVSIISSDGENKVATTVVNEKNGWLYLSAKGFTFSSPTVRVELSQEASPLPAPEMTTQAAPKPAVKKMTITCAKGKVKKKVTAVKPACPKGYKKVA
jgi:hypothetical protein